MSESIAKSLLIVSRSGEHRVLSRIILGFMQIKQRDGELLIGEIVFPLQIEVMPGDCTLNCVKAWSEQKGRKKSSLFSHTYEGHVHDEQGRTPAATQGDKNQGRFLLRSSLAEISVSVDPKSTNQVGENDLQREGSAGADQHYLWRTY